MFVLTQSLAYNNFSALVRKMLETHMNDSEVHSRACDAALDTDTEVNHAGVIRACILPGKGGLASAATRNVSRQAADLSQRRWVRATMFEQSPLFT